MLRDVAARLDGERVKGEAQVRLSSGVVVRCLYRSSPEQTGAALVNLLMRERADTDGKLAAFILNDRFALCALEDYKTIREQVQRSRGDYVVGQAVQVRHLTWAARYLDEWLEVEFGRARVAVAIRLRYKQRVAIVWEI
jgi:hypothetical protein